MDNYIPPSQCDRCIPTEQLTNNSSMSWVIETAHQTICPNHPANKEATH